MNINNNYLNQQNSNQALSFKAAFKTELPVKNLKRLANIQDLFAKKTQHYANDTLTLTVSKDPSFKDYPVLTTNPSKMGCEDYKYSHLIDSLDTLMDKMSDNEIVKKFVNYFKMMKKEEAFDNSVAQADKVVKHLTAVKDKNEFLAKSCFESGKNTLGLQYEAIANNIQKKLDSVKLQHETDKTKMISDMEKIANNEPALNFVPDLFGSTL